MANIQQYLSELEYRLAQSVDSQLLQERLTEAENHLRDRAQEFEEIGLPRFEAEARAVADFGAADEFTQNLPPRFVPPAPPRPVEEPTPVTPVEVSTRRDIALQLAWSAVALGLVAAMFSSSGALAGGCCAAIFIGLGGLFGRPASLRHLGALSVVAGFVLFFVLSAAYEPVQRGWDGIEKIGIKHKNEESSVDRAHQYALSELTKLEKMAAQVKLGDYPRSPWGSGYIVPFVPDAAGWRYRYNYGYSYGVSSMETNSLEQAKLAWKSGEDAARQYLEKAVGDTAVPNVPLPPSETRSRFTMLAVMGGVVLMAMMAGFQALFMAMRTFFRWFGRLVRRASQPRSAPQGWEPYR